MTTHTVENELETLKTKNLRMEQMLRQTIPLLLELCRTHSIVHPESGSYAGRTAAICKTLVDEIESELSAQELSFPKEDSFIVSRRLLEDLMEMAATTSCSHVCDEVKRIIYGSAPVDEERAGACLKACEGIPTEWLKENPDEANIRLRGEREQRLREHLALPGRR